MARGFMVGAGSGAMISSLVTLPTLRSARERPSGGAVRTLLVNLVGKLGANGISTVMIILSILNVVYLLRCMARKYVLRIPFIAITLRESHKNCVLGPVGCSL